MFLPPAVICISTYDSKHSLFQDIFVILRRLLLNSLFITILQGPPNKKSICTTCDGNFQNCPGHYGYLKLDLPVYNVGFFNFILDILKCICKVTELADYASLESVLFYVSRPFYFC